MLEGAQMEAEVMERMTRKRTPWPLVAALREEETLTLQADTILVMNVADRMAVMWGDGRGGHIEVTGILVLVSMEVSDGEVAIKGLDRLIIMWMALAHQYIT
jgi:hypothetical protein